MGISSFRVFAWLLLVAASPLLAEGWITSFDRALAVAQKERHPVLLEFTAVWCGYCRQMKKEIFSRPEFFEKASGFVLVSIDGEREAAIADRYHVNGFPTILFLDRNGVEISRVAGYVSAERFYGRMASAYEERELEQSRLKAVEAAPDGFRANYEMGVYYGRAGHYAKARDFYWRAYRSGASDQDQTGQMRRKALYNLAALSMRLEEYALAASLWSAYVRTQEIASSDLAYARYWRAVCRLKAKEGATAGAEIREDLEYAVARLPFAADREEARALLKSL